MKKPTKQVPLIAVCANADDIKCGPFGTQLNKDEFRSEGVPLWGIKQVNVGFSIPTKEFLEPRTANRLRQYELRPGDIVMTRKGTVGNCAVYPAHFEVGIMHSDLLRVRVDEERCDPSFLVHQLHHSPAVARQLSLISGGAIMPGINVGRLKQLEVVLPPLPEQRRIAEVLDRAEVLRSKRRAALAELDLLTQSIFLDLFGDPMSNHKEWKTCLLEDVAHKITDGTHRTPVYKDSGVEFLSAKDLKEGGVAWGTGKFISEEEHLDLVKRCNPELGDILLAKSGSLGNVAIIDRAHQFSLFESLCLIKHDRARIEGHFLTGLLRVPSMLAHLLGKNKGVAIKHLHLVDVRNLRIPLPPLSLQQEFARRVAAVETLKAAHRTSLAELDALFASLQHRAFRGEL